MKTLTLQEAYHKVGRPYLRTFNQSLVLEKSRINWVTCSPLMSKIFCEAEVWYVDCTYNETIEKGETLYLMNFVTYVDELQRRKSFKHLKK